MNLTPDPGLSRVDDLLKRFEEIHNYIYANDGLSTQQTLEEFIKILFVKISDEYNRQKHFRITSEEFNDLKHTNTSHDFLQRLRKLFEITKKEFKDVFDHDDKIRLSANSLGFTVNKLQSILLSDSSTDAKGLAFQKFLEHQEKRGRGQFFTPEPVIKFCVDIIQPRPTECILDPACGSGGFLISSLNYLSKTYPNLHRDNFVRNNLFGIDINKSIARIAKMKLLLEANEQANILCANSLDDLDEIKLLIANESKKNILEGFDIILTNPPFGTAGKITNTKMLSQFDLGHKWISDNGQFSKIKTLSKGVPAEILFIERCLQLLKEGGRLGIVLPNGHFENSSLEYLRVFIKQKAKILAIINLPQETFIPYGTGVKTSILFLEKGSETIVTEYPIFFGKITKPGYQGNKNGTPVYKKDKYGIRFKDDYGNPIIDEDFTKVIQDFKSFQNIKSTNSENSFSIDYKEINGRFDYDFYSPENRKMINSLECRNAKKLSELVEIIKVKSKKLNIPDKIIEYVELSDINTHSFEIINSTSCQVHELPGRASYEIKTGDIITAVAGNSIGTKKHATALVTKEFDGCICTNGFRVLRNFKIDPYFLLYFLKSDSFLKQVYMYRTGAAIPNISDNDLSNILVNIPDAETVKSVSKKMGNAFNLRQESKKQIESINLEFA
jgi:type I restriction enzyme M protein